MNYDVAIKMLKSMITDDIGDQQKEAISLAIAALEEKSHNTPCDESVVGMSIDQPVCKVGDTIYVITDDAPAHIEQTKVKSVQRVNVDGKWTYRYRAKCIFNDWGNAIWNFFDKDFGEKFFTDPIDAVKARQKMVLDDEFKLPCNEGDKIPYVVNGKTIYYIVEKIKFRPDGTIKIRCKHGGGGQPRSFTDVQARTLLKTDGKRMN